MAAAQRQATQEPGRERVAATGGVDHVDRERWDALGYPVAGNDESALSAGGGGDTADPALDQPAAALLEVARAAQGEHLLVVGQQEVEMGERRADPVEDLARLLPRGEDVGGG